MLHIWRNILWLMSDIANQSMYVTCENSKYLMDVKLYFCCITVFGKVLVMHPNPII